MNTLAKHKWSLTTLGAGFLAIATIASLPTFARADNAKVVWNKMQLAAARAKSVRIRNSWNERGKSGQMQIWADDRRVRIESPGWISIYADGRCESYRSEPEEIFEKVGEADAVGIVSPRDFNVAEQIKRLQVYGGDVVAKPDQTFAGERVKVIGLENTRNGFRYTFLIDPKSGLPIRKVDEQQKDGRWVEISHQDFAFNVALPESLFIAPISKRRG